MNLSNFTEVLFIKRPKVSFMNCKELQEEYCVLYCDVQHSQSCFSCQQHFSNWWH